MYEFIDEITDYGRRLSLKLEPVWFSVRNFVKTDPVKQDPEDMALPVEQSCTDDGIFLEAETSGHLIDTVINKETGEMREFVIINQIEEASLHDCEVKLNECEHELLTRQPLSLLDNTADNPIHLIYNPANRIREVDIPTYMSAVEYSDTNDFVLSMIVKKIHYRKSCHRFFVNPITKKYSLKIRHGKKSSLTLNDRLMMDNHQIHTFFKILFRFFYVDMNKTHEVYSPFSKLLAKHFTKGHFPDPCASSQTEEMRFARLYKVKRNYRLSELPWSPEEMISLYESYKHADLEDLARCRKSVNRYLRMGNTKKATDACFFNIKVPKSIRRLLLKTMPAEFSKSAYKQIQTSVKKHGVNVVRSLLLKDDAVTPNKHVIEHPCYLAALDLGYTPTHIKKYLANTSRDSVVTLSDLITMYTELKVIGMELPFNKNIQRFHDDISVIYNQYLKKGHPEKIKLYKKVKTHKQLPRLRADGYIFRSPKNTYELIAIGSEMNHCVASYTDRFFFREVEMAVVTDFNGKYLACIEIRGDHIVQAKIHSNNRLSSNRTILNFVLKWAKKHDYKIATHDAIINNHTDYDNNFFENDFPHIPQNSRDPERIDLYNAAGLLEGQYGF